MKYIKIKEKGNALIISVIFFIVISTTIIFGFTNPIVSYISSVSAVSSTKKSFYGSEALLEDVVYRLKSGLTVSSPQNITIGSTTVTAVIGDESGYKTIVSTGNNNNFIRKNKSKLILGEGVAFNYGIQVGEGGLVLQNSSSITGNVYSNGTISGSSNLITGSVVSASNMGVVNGIRSTDSVYANSIQNSIIDKNAYYTNIINSTVYGVSYPNSPNQGTTTFPISNTKIDEWKDEALQGGIISSPCPYRINSTTTIGPKKINCDLEISGNNITVSLAGHVWVSGNIKIKNSPIVKVATSLGQNSVALIADNLSDRLSSGKVEIENSTTFQGSGSSNSYVLVVSNNNSAKNGGSVNAILIKNSVSGALVSYSNEGATVIENSVSLKEITSYKLTLKNTANVVYESGLVNLIFNSGPSGGFDISNWGEVE